MNKPDLLLRDVLCSSSADSSSGDLKSWDCLVGFILQSVTAGNTRSLFLSILITTSTGRLKNSRITWQTVYIVEAVIAIITTTHNSFFTGPIIRKPAELIQYHIKPAQRYTKKSQEKAWECVKNTYFDIFFYIYTQHWFAVGVETEMNDLMPSCIWLSDHN